MLLSLDWTLQRGKHHPSAAVQQLYVSFALVTCISSANVILEITALFWVIRQRVMAILPTFRDNLSVPSSRVKKGPIGCSETLARNYYYSLRNNPEECNSHLLRGASLKSRNTCVSFRQNSKDKTIPVQAWTGPKGSRKLRLPDFMTIGTLRW